MCVSPLYEIFSGNDLIIAQKIQRRRLQLLVHSYIYYEKNDNIVPDQQWSAWAEELRQIQTDYPEIASKVPYGKGFDNWDASTGAYLPYMEYPNLIKVADDLVAQPIRNKPMKDTNIKHNTTKLF